MEKSSREINGRTIEYLDVIHHRVNTKFGFWDRVKILFGKEVITNSEIYTEHDHCLVVGSTAKTHVPPMIILKSKDGLEKMSPIDTQSSRDNKLENILKK